MPQATVFVSYSHQDEVWKTYLMEHLGYLERQGLVAAWHDQHIEAGEDWRGRIQQAMDNAQVAVLLISPGFLSSQFIFQVEFPHLLERKRSDGLHLLPVLVRPCAWEAVPELAALQIRPTGSKPLAALRKAKRDSELTKIAEEILHWIGTQQAPFKSADGTVAFPPSKQKSVLLPQVQIELLYVPSGSFHMGSESPEDPSDERPVHSVQVPAFWIGRFAVTNRQYAQFLQATGREEPAFWDDPKYNHPTQPVLGVSWHEAKEFCRWVTQIVERTPPSWWTPGTRVRLPTEAEWEYAVRGPAGHLYPWGDGSPTRQLANYEGGLGAPASVGNYPEGASWVGAMDMAGNGWEWCEDHWHDNYEEAPTDGSAWIDPAGGDARVVRGGSFYFGPRGLRATYRYMWHADKRDGNQGLRVVASTIG